MNLPYTITTYEREQSKQIELTTEFMTGTKWHEISKKAFHEFSHPPQKEKTTPKGNTLRVLFVNFLILTDAVGILTTPTAIPSEASCAIHRVHPFELFGVHPFELLVDSLRGSNSGQSVGSIKLIISGLHFSFAKDKNKQYQRTLGKRRYK